MRIALRRFRVTGSLPPESCAPGPLSGATRLPEQALRSFGCPERGGWRWLEVDGGRREGGREGQGFVRGMTRGGWQCRWRWLEVVAGGRGKGGFVLAEVVSSSRWRWLEVVAGGRGGGGFVLGITQGGYRWLMEVVGGGRAGQGGGRGRRGEQRGREGRGFVLVLCPT
ncbi:uncharacterized protein [Neodiprion pinetum]|uniref:uncharacterized protein n=1 Tax=Neodiprion pinetum TaxID=441929 RepID=UPI0037224817